MLSRNHPDRIQITFDDRRLVANVGLLLPATLARHLGLPELVQQRLDLGDAPLGLHIRRELPISTMFASTQKKAMRETTAQDCLVQWFWTRCFFRTKRALLMGGGFL